MAPNLREAYCQAIFLFPFSQLNKLESVQRNWSPNSWAHSAPLPVRLHLAVNSDRSWTVIHIKFSGYSHRNTLSFCLCFSSFLPPLSLHFPSLSLCLSLIVTVCLCRISMIYDELHNSATSHRCLYKAPLSADNASFHCSEKGRILYIALLLKEW